MHTVLGIFYPFLVNSMSFIKSKSGVRSDDSTETALLTDNWLKAKTEGKIVGTVMVDFPEMFDLVDHELLKAVRTLQM